ncbi:MAG: capsular biosynthesis protein, partial [Clostridia bacterium]|nr:capsular biosynthesis protein [Clostridia bacterium]
MSANRETKEVAVQRSGSNKTDEMTIDLSELFYRILDHWVLVVLIGLLGAILAFGITRFMITPKYESTAKIYVLSSSDSVVNLSDMQIGSYLASDYQEVFNTREVHEQVISNLRLPDTFEQLKKKLKVSNLTGTRILSIMVEETDPNTAAAIANEFASVASDYIATVMVTDRPTVLSTAVPAAGPSSPNLVKNVFIGAVAGALLVIAIITIAT